MRLGRRTHPVQWSCTTTLGFVPALVFIVIAQEMNHIVGWAWLLSVRQPGTLVMANEAANVWLLGIVAAAYTGWILAVARGWITTATGGGFVLAGHALIVRILVECPHSMGQVPLAEQLPPEPYATFLPFARTCGLVVFVAGLGFVLAAVIAERRLRRVAPEWAITP